MHHHHQVFLLACVTINKYIESTQFLLTCAKDATHAEAEGSQLQGRISRWDGHQAETWVGPGAGVPSVNPDILAEVSRPPAGPRSPGRVRQGWIWEEGQVPTWSLMNSGELGRCGMKGGPGTLRLLR